MGKLRSSLPGEVRRGGVAQPKEAILYHRTDVEIHH